MGLNRISAPNLRIIALGIVALPAVVATARADDAWLYAPAPEHPSTTIAADPATVGPARPMFSISDRSRSAWRSQGDFLGQRLRARGLAIGDPLHIRIFKQSRELELYLDNGERFVLYRRFPICEMSGTLGPKLFEGDLQAPEGVYSVTAERLHPNSDFHLAFNLGYPNAIDRALGRTGSNIMIHGGCASNGCFAMTDYYMEQLYVLAEAALRAGQSSIGVEIYPFRMTEDNLKAWSGSRWHSFWTTLKPVFERFERSGIPPTAPEVAARILPASRSDGTRNAPSISAP